jgi:hypothetical protein
MGILPQIPKYEANAISHSVQYCNPEHRIASLLVEYGERISEHQSHPKHGNYVSDIVIMENAE